MALALKGLSLALALEGLALTLALEGLALALSQPCYSAKREISNSTSI